jgi:hypothetical protein
MSRISLIPNAVYDERGHAQTQLLEKQQILSKKDSLDDKVSRVRDAVSREFSDNAGGMAYSSGGYDSPSSPVQYACCTQIFDDYVVFSKGGKLFMIDYSYDPEGGVEFPEGQEPVEVENAYVTKESAVKEGLGYGPTKKRMLRGPIKVVKKLGASKK